VIQEFRLFMAEAEAAARELAKDINAKAATT
jgi:hypothetical protein